MKKNDRFTEALYIERDKCIYSSCLAAIIFVTFTIVFNEYKELTKSIISIIVIIGACSVIMLTAAVLKIYEAAYYRIMCSFYIFAALANIGNLIFKEEFNYIWSSSQGTRLAGHTLFIFILTLICLKMTECVDEVKNRKVGKYLFGAICIAVTYYSSKYNYGYFVIEATNIIVLFYGHLINKELKEFEFSNGSRINTILYILYSSRIIITLNIINVALKGKIELIDLIIRVLVFACYISNLVITIDKLLNRPYKVLFSDLYKQNTEMNELNNEVVRKNRELEFSQAIIKKKEKMFKTFFSSVPVPLAIISEKGRVTFINSSFKELVDEDNIKNIINRKINSIIKSKNEDDGEYSFMKEHSIISGVFEGKKEQKYVDMELVDISNNKEECLIIFNDVTSKIKIGQLRAEMENNIFQERIKRDFLSNISHDLKTPINVIYSAAQLISVYIDSGNREALKKYNLISKLNCIALIRLTNNLIDSSRIYSDYLSANLQVKNIVEIVEETVTSLIDYAKNKDINLLFDTDEEEIYVNFDDEFMQRIVINLVSNAIKFSREGGKIEVIIQTLEEKVKLLIIDNGIGMEEEFIERAFSRYAMGKNNENRSEKGTGIGLFVVKKLVEKQNGEIFIKSKINEGTEIEMQFNKELYNG
ncbi:HAMP domain-containing sensor histidine kinase [Clostridium sp. HBUAS56017]|uniref:sensor histidine kinase n=1 Tax=Clostridium sp. HBUAS56017 TaxID=2571128 RepID=UPI001178038E|nr:HAMP domain-containing sensor histidine kinase [Clostridium sp. HBUAS56017]